MVLRHPSIVKKKNFVFREIRFGEEVKLYANMLAVCVAILATSAILIVSGLSSGVVIVELLWVVWLSAFLETIMVWQLVTKRRSLFLNSLLGGIAFFVSFFLFFSCNMGCFSPVCFLLFPHVGLVVKHPKYTITVSAVLLTSAAVLLLTPTYNLLNAAYSDNFRCQYPLMLLFALSIVCYLEALRQRMNRKLAIMEKELRTMAYRDQLTKSYNRHALISHHGNLFNGADGHSFALIDLDDFKRINDTYGHFIGDDVLRHVTDVVQHQIPAEGCLYRWGGEEFLIVAREIPKEEFVALLEKIRTAIHRSPLCKNGKSIYVTASFGAVCEARGVSIQSCLLQADKQLYFAKKNGKNQVMYQKAS